MLTKLHVFLLSDFLTTFSEHFPYFFTSFHRFHIFPRFPTFLSLTFFSFRWGSPRPCYFIKNRTSFWEKTYWKIFSCQWKVSGQRRRFGRTRSAVRTRYSNYYFSLIFSSLILWELCLLFYIYILICFVLYCLVIVWHFIVWCHLFFCYHFTFVITFMFLVLCYFKKIWNERILREITKERERWEEGGERWRKRVRDRDRDEMRGRDRVCACVIERERER